MNKNTSITKQGLTPEKLTGLKKNILPKKSAGITAVFSALSQINKYVSKKNILKLMFKVNQRNGFDCPGCAWPDPDDERGVLGEYCENGIKAISEEAQSKTITREFFKKNSVSSLLEKSDFELGKSGRLTEPMVVREGQDYYQPISWKEAFKLVGEELNNLKSPDEAIFYTSGRTSNEAAFMYQLFVRSFGTNNLPDCSNMCHEASGVALSKTVGIGKGSVTLSDIHKAEVVMVIGQNPGTNHPRMLLALEKCKKNGGKIIAVNPIKEVGLVNFVDPKSPFKVLKGGTDLADLYVQISINKDLAFLKSLIKILHEEEKAHPGTVFDKDFIENKTTKYKDFINGIEKENLESLVAETGLELKVIQEVAELMIRNKKIIVCWAMGLTQHRDSVNVIQEIVNLLLIKGSIGKEGAGTCPVRGHSNVQGDRTMGIWEKPKEVFLKKLDEVFNIKAPRKNGYAVVEAIKAMKKKKGKVFFAMGGNFLSATPDTAFTAEALENCNLTAHVSTKLNRSHLIHGKTGLILPCKGRTDIDIRRGKEQFITVENSMGYISGSHGVLKPHPQLKSEPEIVADLANATFDSKNKASEINWEEMSNNYNLVRDYIGKTIPGFENYNSKVSLHKGFYLPNCARAQNFSPVTGKALFTVNPIEKDGSWGGLKKDEMMMMTVRSHDQFNTTIYGLDDRYRGIHNERRVVLINQQDSEALGFKEGDLVDLVSHYGEERKVTLFKVVYYDIAKKCIATYFPEANALVPITEGSKESHTPAYKSIKIKLLKH